MKLLFEKSVKGRRSCYLPGCDVTEYALSPALCRAETAGLPELSETDVSRHYSALERRAYGVNDGFYPLGSCTMKYNPKLNERMASLPGFAEIHPLQPEHTVGGCLDALALAERQLCEITGMDHMSFQPAAGAHGELTGVMLIKKYHELRGDAKRTTLLVPDSAHGTNPATAVMCGMNVVNLPSDERGCVDLNALRAAVGPDTAGLMLTNPNTLGIFEQDICSISEIVHQAGGLLYYDGANLNAVMGVVRPGDMGFDCVHLNLHKTFATPHGGGGPGSGAVGCKAFLAPYLPRPQLVTGADGACFKHLAAESIGAVKSFYGNFSVVLKALAYVLTLGAEGVRETAQNAVLNANYFMHRLKERYTVVNQGLCMHEFVLTLERESKECGFTAMDIAKGLLDCGMHPPTMYFPLIVHEALMAEPTETEGKEMLDEAAEVYLALYDRCMNDPAAAKAAPVGAVLGRPDEVAAARNPVLRWRAE